jgi:hypothetical protein
MEAPVPMWMLELLADEDESIEWMRRYVRHHGDLNDKTEFYVDNALMSFSSFDKNRLKIKSDVAYFNILRMVHALADMHFQYSDILNRCYRPRKRNRKYSSMMLPHEVQELEKLPSRVTIYRGVADPSHIGWSWSLSRPIAEWFAGRWPEFFGDEPILIIGNARKADILAYFTAGGEERNPYRPEVGKGDRR